jgi:putative SOS response-associated peptidase YedK
MCGRFALGIPKIRLEEYFRCPMPDFDLSWNVAPGDHSPVIGLRSGARRGGMMRWGLVPSWAEEEKTGYSMINARAETVAHKPAFRSSFAKRRCIVPAEGFFEWQKREDDGKQPYFTCLESGEPMGLAGVWSSWSPSGDGEAKGADPLLTFCIITTPANRILSPVHPRMPAILFPANFQDWLQTPAENADDLVDILAPFPDDLLHLHPVSTRVNTPTAKGPEVIEPRGRGVPRHGMGLGDS